jgi:hypothetical protein
MNAVNQNLSWRYKKSTGELFIVDEITVPLSVNEAIFITVGSIDETGPIPNLAINIKKIPGTNNSPYTLSVFYKKITLNLATVDKVRTEISKLKMVNVEIYEQISQQDVDQMITTATSTIVIIN